MKTGLKLAAFAGLILAWVSPSHAGKFSDLEVFASSGAYFIGYPNGANSLRPGLGLNAVLFSSGASVAQSTSASVGYKPHRVLNNAGTELFGVTQGGGLTGSAVPIFDARGWGAVGDNVTDDGPAFQAAHDALPAAGGTIFVPAVPGGSKYAIATKITITKPVHFLCAGHNTVLRANGAIEAIILVNSGGDASTIEGCRFEGSKTGTGGTIQRGIYVNGAKDVTIQYNVFSGSSSVNGFNFGIDILGTNSGRTRVLYNRIERLVSSAQSGSAVLIEYSDHNVVWGNVIDGSEFNNADGTPGAAIFLSATAGGDGSTYNLIGFNRITNHRQVGMGINSTTYSEFQGDLGECSHNRIVGNEITLSSAAGGGDASSGIVMVGNSNFNEIVENKIHHNGHPTAGGYGIVISGSQGLAKTITDATNATPIVITATAHGFSTGNSIGISGVAGNTAANGTWTVSTITANTFSLNTSVGNGAYTSGGKAGVAGTPKIDEAPNYNQIVGNYVHDNQDEGIRLNGPTNTTIRANTLYENGQRTANTFSNIHIASIGGAANGGSNIVIANDSHGAQPKYGLEIGLASTGTVVTGNYFPNLATGGISDGGTSTVFGPNITANNLEFKGAARYSGVGITLTGAAGTIVSGSSITAGAFYGDSTNLTRTIKISTGATSGSGTNTVMNTCAVGTVTIVTSGYPLLVTFAGAVRTDGAAGTFVGTQMMLDGVATAISAPFYTAAANYSQNVSKSGILLSVSAGTHYICHGVLNTAGTWTDLGGMISVMEIR